MKKKFPTFAVIVLVFALTWLLKDLKVITFDVPWFPLILVVISLGWIINNYLK